MTKKNRRSSSEAIAQRAGRGFSLIEAAIVLAVVGLVIGGIWVAASAVYENYKVNKTVEGILVISENIQKLISKRDSEYLGIGNNLGWLAQEAGLYPKSWPYGATLPVTWNGFFTPYGGTSTWSSFPTGVSWDGFRIQLFFVKNSQCVKILTKYTSILARTGNTLKNIQIDNGNGGPWPGFGAGTAMTTSAVTTACASLANSNTLYFTFDYTRNN